MDSNRVVVVGAGLGGLAAAAFLARAGSRVTLLEKATAPGGRATTRVEHGFSMNLGPHALYLGGPAQEALDELGVAYPGKSPSASGVLGTYGGRVHTLPTGFVSLLTTGLLPLSGKLEAARVLGRASAIDPGPLASTTLSDWLDKSTTSPEVRSLLEMLVRVSSYTNAPEVISAGAALTQFQGVYRNNVLYLDGGWQTLVNALRTAAVEAGVRIETSAKVKRVDVQEGEARGVVIEDGRVFGADHVVLAGSPAVARAFVPEDASLARFAAEALPASAACLDVALDTLPYPRNLVLLGLDRPYYASVHSASANLAPPGSALIHVAKYLAPDGPDAEATEQELEAFLDLLQPGALRHVVTRRFLPKLRVTNAVVAARTNGVAGRPRHDGADTRRLHVVGDWVGPRGMLADASFASARAVASAIAAAEAGPRAVRAA